MEHGIPNIASYLDDVLVTGTEHMATIDLIVCASGDCVQRKPNVSF